MNRKIAAKTIEHQMIWYFCIKGQDKVENNKKDLVRDAHALKP